MTTARLICRLLLKHAARRADAFALPNAGNNSAASKAMIAMTTKSSINVKARFMWPVILPDVPPGHERQNQSRPKPPRPAPRFDNRKLAQGCAAWRGEIRARSGTDRKRSGRGENAGRAKS